MPYVNVVYTETTDYSEQFKDELAAAKADLIRDQSCDLKSCDLTSKGHRAGFDAFMTGYAFACYCLNTIVTDTPTGDSPDKATPTNSEQSYDHLLSGMSQLRNCINNTGLATPIRIRKSQFSKPSEEHRIVWTRITNPQ